jgi:hypothetical protein
VDRRGCGEVVAHLEDPPATEPTGGPGADGHEDADADADDDG